MSEPVPDWKRYVENHGLACPYCGSEDLESGPLDADGSTAHAAVVCNGCDREWTDIFRLVDAAPAEDEPAPPGVS